MQSLQLDFSSSWNCATAETVSKDILMPTPSFIQTAR
jgi:hypothetical protein